MNAASFNISGNNLTYELKNNKILSISAESHNYTDRDKITTITFIIGDIQKTYRIIQRKEI